MDAPDIDLSRERADRLEDTQKRFGATWRRQALRYLGVSALYATAAAVAVMLAVFCVGVGYTVLQVLVSPPPHGSYAPTWDLPGWAPWALLFIAGAVFVHQARVPLKMLSISTPQACRNPQDTIRQFFESFLEVVTHSVWRPGPWLQAWVCLLDQVKDSYYDYQMFIQRSYKRGTEVRSLLQRAAIRRLRIEPSWHSDRVHLSWEGQSGPFDPYRPLRAFAIEAMPGIGGLIPFRVSTTVQATYGSERGGTLRGPLRLVLTVTLAQVGERWYVAALPSSEEVEEAIAEPTAKSTGNVACR
jgi:hypothetical protein